MEYDRVLSSLEAVRTVNKEFLAQHEEMLMEFFLKEEKTAEESLEEEILLELTDKIARICCVIDYMKKEIVYDGNLNLDTNGNVMYGQNVLSALQEIEVYIYDEEAEKEVWTRTYVGIGSKPYLVGLNKNIKIQGLKVRIRE